MNGRHEDRIKGKLGSPCREGPCKIEGLRRIVGSRVEPSAFQSFHEGAPQKGRDVIDLWPLYEALQEASETDLVELVDRFVTHRENHHRSRF